jgi:hypothetical protein
VGKADLAKNAVTNRSVRNRSLAGLDMRLTTAGNRRRRRRGPRG